MHLLAFATAALPLPAARHSPATGRCRAPAACVSTPRPPARLRHPRPPNDLPDEAALHAALAATPGLLVLQVYSTSCRACAAMQRAVARVAAAHAHHARFVALDGGREKELAQRLGVRAMPTFVLYRAGKRVDHFACSREEVLERYVEDNV